MSNCSIEASCKWKKVKAVNGMEHKYILGILMKLTSYRMKFS